MSASPPIILWFRQDLRLQDLPSLAAAQRDGGAVVAVYIFDDDAAGDWAPGGASRWWLHHSLRALKQAIAAEGGTLLLRRGGAEAVLKALCLETGATAVYCSRRYEPWAAEQERALHVRLADANIELRRFGGTLLHEPGTVLTQAGEPFKVFTPFWRSCRRVAPPTPIAQSSTRWLNDVEGDQLDDWALLPERPNWAAGWESLWTPGAEGASAALNQFLDGPIAAYTEGRDFPAEALTSRLSPHLHHGEISPRQIWARSEQARLQNPESTGAVEKFQAELGWREFSYHLLHYFPTIPEAPFKASFSPFPWVTDDEGLRRWQRGLTGYPIVDAGMRELWQTGYMHNRVRMVVASFLCKHLLTHWRRGADWFWDTLLDADLASNSCSWQWVAGSGADAAPYFRIFNPVTQGEKFDRDGRYVRRWVPELAALPDKYLHKPWEAPEAVLNAANITLGEEYPQPVVEHRAARQAALDAYATLKG